MSAYFDYQNPPPSRDVQADLDRIPDHFARLAAVHCENGCNGCDDCTDYEGEDHECNCTEYLRPECDGVGCAAERANERRRERGAS